MSTPITLSRSDAITASVHLGQYADVLAEQAKRMGGHAFVHRDEPEVEAEWLERGRRATQLCLGYRGIVARIEHALKATR